MMRRIFTLTIGLVTAVSGLAITQVTTTRGQLRTLVDDTAITSLAVSGTMDASDFDFIATELTELTELDLSGVTAVEAYDNRFDKALGQYSQPAGVIPPLAFMGTKLQTVTLPACVSAIGEGAFAGTPITSITLPESVTVVGSYAFSGCEQLVTVTAAKIDSVGTGAWAHCVALEKASFEALKTLGDMAFLDCPALATIAVQGNARAVGALALAGTGLTSLDGVVGSATTELGRYALTAADKLTTAAGMDNVATMGQGVFLYDNALTTVTVPTANRSVIEPYTFAGCAALDLADVVPEGISDIGDYAFYNIDRATELMTLPSTLTHIGTRALAGTTGIKSYSIDASPVPAVGERVWDGVDQSKVYVDVPEDIREQYRSADQWLEFAFEKSYLRGDVNADGMVNATDLSCVVNVIAGLMDRAQFEGRDDVNGDNQVNATDLSEVVNIIAGISQAPAVTMPANTTDIIDLDDVAIAPGQTRTIAVKLQNSRAYTAMQCDITLPEGLTVVDRSATARTSRHSIVMAQEGRTVRLIAYSMQQRAIEGNEGEIFTLTVKADKRLVTDAIIEVGNTVLSNELCDSYFTEPTQARVVNTSGVDNVETATARVYTTAGELHIESDQATTATIVAMNGTFVTVDVEAGHNRWPLAQGIYVVRIDDAAHKVIVK